MSKTAGPATPPTATLDDKLTLLFKASSAFIDDLDEMAIQLRPTAPAAAEHIEDLTNQVAGHVLDAVYRLCIDATGPSERG